MKNRIFVFIGTSGAGKTYYSKKLIAEHGYKRIYAITTRPPRPTHPDEYIHVSVPEFEKMIENGEMLEYNIFNGNYYGRKRQDIVDGLKTGQAVIDMSTNRVAHLKKEFPDAIVILIALPEPVIENTKKRVSNRNWTDEELATRLKIVREELVEIAEADKARLVDHKITTIEGDPDSTFKLIKDVIDTYK